MPFCFSLTRIDEIEPTPLTQVDAEICAYFSIPLDEDKWAFGWYNTIGLLLALGNTYEEVRQHYSEEPMALALIKFLEENFIPSSWRELTPTNRRTTK